MSNWLNTTLLPTGPDPDQKRSSAAEPIWCDVAL